MAQIDQRIFSCRKEIQRLENIKESALEEVRNGLFCSKCERSKSEIERAERVSFAQHLQDVKGTAIARAGLLAEKAAFYDRQIAALQKQIADLERMKGQLADTARQQADLERQRAAAAERERKLAAERVRMRQVQAQLEQAQRERDRIVQKGTAKAEGYRQAGQAASDGIKQVGDVLIREMQRQQAEEQRRSAEARAEREQERYDRQVTALEEKLQAQQQQIAAMEKETPGFSGNGNYDGSSFQLPAPIQLYEPPNEQQLLRGEFRADDESERNLILMNERSTGRNSFDVASTPNTYNSLADDLFGDLKASARGLGDTDVRWRDNAREALSSDAVNRYAQSILTDSVTDGEVKPVNTALQQWFSQQYWRYIQRLVDKTIYSTPPENMDEWERLWLIGPRDIVQHGASAILKKDPREPERTVRSLDEALKKSLDGDDLFKP